LGVVGSPFVKKEKRWQISSLVGIGWKFASVVIIGLPKESKWAAIRRNGRGRVAIQCDRELALG
jgi:hypothetical protein